MGRFWSGRMDSSSMCFGFLGLGRPANDATSRQMRMLEVCRMRNRAPRQAAVVTGGGRESGAALVTAGWPSCTTYQ